MPKFLVFFQLTTAFKDFYWLFFGENKVFRIFKQVTCGILNLLLLATVSETKIIRAFMYYLLRYLRDCTVNLWWIRYFNFCISSFNLYIITSITYQDEKDITTQPSKFGDCLKCCAIWAVFHAAFTNWMREYLLNHSNLDDVYRMACFN